MPSYKDSVCEIEIDGVPWTETSHGGVVDSVEIIDEDGAFLTARLTVSGLTVDEMGSSDFRAGVIVRIQLGYPPDGVFDWGVFKMMKPNYSFGPQRSCSVMLQGQGGESGASLAQMETQETWTYKTIREIVQELADRYGFTTYFGKYDNPPVVRAMVGTVFKKNVDESGVVIRTYVDPEKNWRTSPAGNPLDRGYSGLGVDSTLTPAQLEEAGYGYGLIPSIEDGTGVPGLDTPMPSVSTNGRSHWEFLRDLAQGCGGGRYVHVANGLLMFSQFEPIVGHPPDDSNELEPIRRTMEGYPEGHSSVFTNNAIQVRRKNRTSLGYTGLPSDYYDKRLTGGEDRLKAVDGSQAGVGNADDPYFDGRTPLVFLWEKDSKNSHTFPILNISITENFRQKGGKTSASLIDENSKEEVTEQKEPEPDSEFAYELGEEGIIGKKRETFAGTPAMGFTKIDTAAEQASGEQAAINRADRAYSSKVGSSNSVPSTRAGINAQKSEYQDIVNSMRAGTVPGGDSSDPSSANAGEPNTAEKAGALIDKGIKAAAVKFASTTDDDGFMAGLFGGEKEELERNTQGTADANQYGVFIEFSSFGIPGLYARSAIDLQNLSRWSGGTSVQRIEHKFDVSNNYRIKIKARAPGTFAPSSTNDGDNADPDNLSPEDAQAQSAKPGYKQLMTYVVGEGSFESRSGNIEDDP